MPELPEMEAWRRALNDPVSAFPIVKAGPAHIATLKTFDPPLAALEGRQLEGARRRAKRLLFPTTDGELVLLVHLMTAGRLKYLKAGEAGPKKPAFQLVFEGGARLVLTEAGAKKRAGVWLLTPEEAETELAHLGPEALGIGAERLAEICASESRRLHSLLRDQRAIAGIGRAWANEILHHAKLSPYELTRDVTATAGRRPGRSDRRRARTRARAARSGRERQAHLSRAQQARRTVLRLRHADRPGRLRGAHDLLLPRLPDRRARSQGPSSVTIAALMSDLLQALYRGDNARAAELLQAEPELDVFEAAATGGTDRLRELLDEDPARANAFAADGFHPLGLACFFGHVDAARLLLERGADVNALSRNEHSSDGCASTPPTAAPGTDEATRYALVELALEHGADPNLEQGGGFRAIDAARQNGDSRIEQLLLEHGATT